MRHLDLFSGIGGFALAAEMVWDDVEHTFCDNEPFAQAVLAKHWPNSKIYGDIRQLTADTESRQSGEQTKQEGGEDFSRGNFDLLTGGFPCQPFSQAGRRRGTQDDRYLWPEMLRVIREFNPRWVIGENVGGLVTWSEGMVLEQVHADLEAAGYEVQAFIIPAAGVNAPHRRDRVWIVAHCIGGKLRQQSERGIGASRKGKTLNKLDDEDATDTSSARGAELRELQATGQRTRSNRKGSEKGWNWTANWLEVATKLCTLDDGLPNGLVRPRGWRNAALKGAGNAIVPQVAAEVMRAIKESDERERLL